MAQIVLLESEPRPEVAGSPPLIGLSGSQGFPDSVYTHCVSYGRPVVAPLISSDSLAHKEKGQGNRGMFPRVCYSRGSILANPLPDQRARFSHVLRNTRLPTQDFGGTCRI